MIRVRPAQQHDLEDLMRLAARAGRGMTTVPQSERAMSHRIYLSQQACTKQEPADTGEIFFLVLEDDDGVIGMACVFTQLGAERPFYSYRVSTVSSHSPELDLRTDVRVLHLVNDFHGFTEIATLLVDKDKRGNGIGKLLSFSRFMLMAANPGRFGTRIMAEIRGYADETKNFPFWEHVARKFFHLEFDEADRRSANDFRFIADLMPKYPIYADLLPTEAQAAIGRPHETSQRAMQLLMSQGFTYDNLVDIFDGGPSLQARLDMIETVRNAQPRKTVTGTPPEGAARALIARKSLKDFACIQADVAPSGDVSLSAEDLDALGIQAGDEVLVSPIKPRSTA